MTLPSVAALADAVFDLLNAGPMAVYKSRVEPALAYDVKGTVKGYALLRPGGPSTGHVGLDAAPQSLRWEFQVDCMGGNDTYVLDVVDQVVARLDGQPLTVAGAGLGIIQPPLGYQPPAPYRDPGAKPFQIRVPLQYQILVTPID